jgi:hypothetical protein
MLYFQPIHTAVPFPGRTVILEALTHQQLWLTEQIGLATSLKAALGWAQVCRDEVRDAPQHAKVSWGRSPLNRLFQPRRIEHTEFGFHPKHAHRYVRMCNDSARL